MESEHNCLYTEATQLILSELKRDGVSQPSVSKEGQERLSHALLLLDRVLEINPQNWAALWFAGKAHQARGEHEEALASFMRGRALDPDQPDLAVEAGISAMECGEIALAVESTRTALALRPRDPGLLANLALALLFSDEPVEAKGMVDEALSTAPDDVTTQTVARFIEEVISGNRPCPHCPADLGVRRALS